MLDLFDVMDRATKGEKVAESAYDNLVFKKSREIVKEYGFKCDPKNPLPSDNQLADKIYEAGLRLATEVGGWCIDTGRLIKVTESEIKESLREAEPEVGVGEGREARKIFARKPEDRTPPFFYGGTQAPFSDDLAPKVAKAMAQLPIDGIIPFYLPEISGRQITDTPLETWTNRREMDWTREALVKAGKPGLHILNYPPTTKAAVIIGVLNPDYVRKTDGVKTSPLPEPFKVDFEVLTANNVAREYGCFIEATSESMVGGYAGGYEGSAVVGVAGVLLTHVILFPGIVCHEVPPIFNINLKAIPEVRWTHNVAVQALARNTYIKTRTVTNTSSEPGTFQCLMEIAYMEIGLIASGASAVYTSRPARPKRLNLPTPLEAKWGLEVMSGALGMSRGEANEFMKKIQVPREKLEVQLKGKGFQESYDLKTLTPSKEYLDIYASAKKQLTDLGFNFKD